MLERSLGPGRVRAEATVDMNFDQVHETEERFDPDGQVVRSTQSVSGNNRSSEPSPTVSVQNNLPNADVGHESAGSQEQKQEETTNYEIGKTVRTMVREQPQIRRLSLAVLIDNAEEKGADGKPAWRVRTPEELEAIARLVRSAIGFDEKRGDKVEVVNMRFAGDADVDAPAPRTLFGLPIERADLMRLAQTALLGMVVIAGLLLVLRPMVMRLLNSAAAVPALPAPGGTAANALPIADAGPLLAARPSGDGNLPFVGGVAGSLPDESMVRLDNVEGQLRASSLRRLGELIDKHPEESLSIVRSWMAQEQRS
jgi:flagellar M-ring protein FliF